MRGGLLRPWLSGEPNVKKSTYLPLNFPKPLDISPGFARYSVMNIFVTLDVALDKSSWTRSTANLAFQQVTGLGSHCMF
jgi:hypothetical protein